MSYKNTIKGYIMYNYKNIRQSLRNKNIDVDSTTYINKGVIYTVFVNNINKYFDVINVLKEYNVILYNIQVVFINDDKLLYFIIKIDENFKTNFRTK